MRLYPENEREFSRELFANPSVEYRDVPFWAWNTTMTREDVDFCLQTFKEMGMGGAFLHSRTGMGLTYLGEEFMDLVKYTVGKAKETGIRPWLYDEDRWPSGFAGGLVTSDEEYRSRFLVWSPVPCPKGEIMERLPMTSTAAAVRSGNRKFLGAYEVVSQEGYLCSYRRVEEKSEKANWWAYLEVGGENLWFNGQAYVDTLNSDAIKAFLDTTYEKYWQEQGREFGSLIPGIFTDEPQFTPKQRAGSIDSRKPVFLPFTDKLPELFLQEYGFDLLDVLPELFYEKKGEISQARYYYHRLTGRLFAESYAGQLGKWCESHNIALTGHLMKEPLLSSQCAYVGDAMSSYSYFQIPGIDMLCDRREFTTAKQAQSIVRQYGKEAMISELYGVTNWDFDFRGHKLQGDWQAALGVTVRAPHLAWTSMEGEAKRDYPASIFYQSPWYLEYKMLEDYFARIAMAMSRGQAQVSVGVLHPLETCYLNWGSLQNTGQFIEELDRQFVMMTDRMLGYGIDFDFLSEALLPELYQGVHNGLKIGEMTYQVVLVPFMMTMRAATLQILKEWKASGGKLIFLGRIPSYVEGTLSEEGRALAEDCIFLPDTGWTLYEELQEYAFLELFYGDYRRAEDLLCQVRREGEEKWVFIAHKYAPEKKDLVEERRLTVRIRGAWECTILSALTGTMEVCPCVYEQGQTRFVLPWYAHDSLLLRLRPVKSCGTMEEVYGENLAGEETGNNVSGGDTLGGNVSGGVSGGDASGGGILGDDVTIEYRTRVPVTLSEPNVLVLDMPESSFDGEPWQKAEEILRLDNALRKRLGYPLRTESYPQPWVQREALPAAHEIRLRYSIQSQIECANVSLALEQPEETQITWNGQPVTESSNGWYTDRRIFTISLGVLKKGRNELCLTRKFGANVNLEAVYLLGDFGVTVAGRNAEITAPVRELEFGDWTRQGLPFYGGNVTYHLSLSAVNGPLCVEASRFAAPLLCVEIQGRRQGKIAFSPYCLKTEAVTQEETVLDITAYGSRVNTFGALHNCDLTDNKSAPDYWRTKGSAWSYEYCLRPAGILKAPVITKAERSGRV